MFGDLHPVCRGLFAVVVLLGQKATGKVCELHYSVQFAAQEETAHTHTHTHINVASALNGHANYS